MVNEPCGPTKPAPTPRNEFCVAGANCGPAWDCAGPTDDGAREPGCARNGRNGRGAGVAAGTAVVAIADNGSDTSCCSAALTVTAGAAAAVMVSGRAGP